MELYDERRGFISRTTMKIIIFEYRSLHARKIYDALLRAIPQHKIAALSTTL